MKLGKQWLSLIEPTDDPAAWVPAINEIPAGSGAKYRLDKATGQLALKRMLARPLVYPLSYGFLVDTRSSADDDEVDVMIAATEPIAPLTVLRVRLLGGFSEISRDKGPEDRMLAVIADDPNMTAVKDIDQLENSLRQRIKDFVVSHKRDQGIDVAFEGWFPRDEALAKYAQAVKKAKKRAPV